MIVSLFRVCLNFTRVRFESFFRGCYEDDNSRLSDERKREKRPEENVKMT